MNSKFETLLAQTAEEVFASMVFMFPCEEDSPGGNAPTAPVRAAVAFSGPCAGRLELAVSPGLLPLVAANMLGLPDARAVSAAQQEDALKELANVICGNLLPAIATPRDVFHVHAPRIEDAERPDLRSHAERGNEATRDSSLTEVSARLCLDGGWAESTLYVAQPAEASLV